MATTTVKALAEELKRSSADLLVQLKAAGIEKESESDKITDKDKTALLGYLQKAHGSADAGARKKITLTKRETSEIRQADSTGKTRTVQIEVRKKRVLVKRGDEAAKAVKANEPLIRNQLVALFNQQTSETMNNVEAKEKLRQEALKQTQQVMNDETGKPMVDDLLFNNLIIQ
mgnify:CR=1 FL=1